MNELTEKKAEEISEAIKTKIGQKTEAKEGVDLVSLAKSLAKRNIKKSKKQS